MISLALLSLPTEIIILIFSYLNFQDLVKAQSLNKFFNVLVRNSPALQYIIELGATGHSPANTTLSTSECLRRLKAQQSFFENPSPLKQIKYTTFSNTDNHGNALRLHSTGFYDSLVVRILSNDADAAVVHTYDFDFDPPMETRWPVSPAGIKFESFYPRCVDPCQDLIVLQPKDTDVPPRPLKVKLFSLRNGGSHPKAAISTLSFPLVGGLLHLDHIAVAGPRLLLIGSRGLRSTRYIFVADWEEGSITQVLRYGPDKLLALTPVSPNHFVVAAGHTDRPGGRRFGFIETYLITSEKKDSRTQFTTHLLSRHEIPRHIFDLLPFRNDGIFQNLNADPTSHIPFMRDPSRNILQLAIQRNLRSDLVSLFVPVSIFVDPRYETLQQRHEVPATVHYSWHEWGPTHTASMRISPRYLTTHPPLFMGSRLLTQSRMENEPSCVKVAIKDFNQLSTKRRRTAEHFRSHPPYVHNDLGNDLLHSELEIVDEKTSSGSRRKQYSSSPRYARVIQGHRDTLSEPYAEALGVVADDGSGTPKSPLSKMAFHEIGEWKCIDEQGFKADLQFEVGIGRQWFWGVHVANIDTVRAVSIFVRDE